VKFEDALADRLDKMAEENFELGMTYFRDGNFLLARHHFDMARDVWRDKPRCHIATMLVAYEMSDTNQAVNELMQALRMAKTLDDLKIEDFLDKFYAGDDPDKKRQALSRTVDSVNMFAQAVKDAPAAPAANMLLAYYSWLNGDLVTAVSAADRASRALPDDAAEPVRRFRDMLVEKQRAAETGTTDQPAVK
jgi:tetratricopeptide (TPR) repeat protein